MEFPAKASSARQTSEGNTAWGEAARVVVGLDIHAQHILRMMAKVHTDERVICRNYLIEKTYSAVPHFNLFAQDLHRKNALLSGGHPFLSVF